MKVKELIGILKKLPADTVIYMSRDEEGNSIHDIDCLERWTMMVGPDLMVLSPDERRDYVEEDGNKFDALPKEEQERLLSHVK